MPRSFNRYGLKSMSLSLTYPISPSALRHYLPSSPPSIRLSSSQTWDTSFKRNKVISPSSTCSFIKRSFKHSFLLPPYPPLLHRPSSTTTLFLEHACRGPSYFSLVQPRKQSILALSTWQAKLSKCCRCARHGPA